MLVAARLIHRAHSNRLSTAALVAAAHARRSLSVVAPVTRRPVAVAASAHFAFPAVRSTRRLHMSAPAAAAPKADQKPAAMADGAADEGKGKKEKKKVREEEKRAGGTAVVSVWPSQATATDRSA